MTKGTFEELLNIYIVSDETCRQNTNYRKAISPQERLLVTLRYLATGETAKCLHYQFRMGAATVRSIIYETCTAIWDQVKPLELPELTTEGFKTVSSDFSHRWNFPHVLGAMDGKHIKTECSPNSGSAYFNYKQTFSIVFQGVCDAQSNFIAVDVGDFGRHSDGGVLKHSSFGRALYSNSLPIPESINGSQLLPFVFLGDEACPLLMNMRPYSRRGLDNVWRIYNYMHSRAKRSTECAFGIMVGKWSILKTTLNMLPENAVKFVLAYCVLHNFVRKRDGFDSTEPTTESFELQQDTVDSNGSTMTGRPCQEALDTRNEFAELFLTSLSVPWQSDNANMAGNDI